jgi:hypothetical protein
LTQSALEKGRVVLDEKTEANEDIYSMLKRKAARILTHPDG